MSVRMPTTDERSPSAERLAQAMRSGLDLRWSVPASSAEDSNPFPPGGDARSFLMPHANGLRMSLPRGASLPHRLVRLARYLTRLVIAPWLRLQSRFNLATVRVFEQVEQRVRQLEDAERKLRTTLAALERTYLSCADREWDQHADNLEEAFRLRVNQELGPDGRIGQAGLWFEPPVQVQLAPDGPRITHISERILEEIFVHTHLPRPPARLLALGCSNNTNAIEMASLGFQVVGVDARPTPLRHPNFTMMQTSVAELPFEEEAFDAAVALSPRQLLGRGRDTSEARGAGQERVIAEVFRVLKHGGRFLLTLPFGRRSVYDRARLDRLLHTFRILERGYGVEESDNWSFTLDEQRAEQTEGRAVCLLVLEKP